MLDFINNNGVLFSGVFAVIAALITSLITGIKERKQVRIDTISSLRKDKANLEEELKMYKALAFAEENMDKSEGSIYVEKLPNGKTRDICGFCWEKDHVKIPVVRSLIYDEDDRRPYYGAYCYVCESRCTAKFEFNDENCPF